MKIIKRLLLACVLCMVVSLCTLSSSANEHIHNFESSVIVNETCNEPGELLYTCTCGDSYTESIPAKGHNWELWEDKSMPTCTDEGVMMRYCWDCFGEETKIVPPNGHYYEMEIEPATEKADGKYFSICAECYALEEGKDRIIPKIATVKLSTEVCTYNGKIRNPSVIIKDANGKKLVEGTDYVRLAGGDMKKPGYYIVSVKFKNKYKGEAKLSFTIKPKAPTKLNFISDFDNYITLTWEKSVGAVGYRVYQYSPSKNKYVLKDSVKSIAYSVSDLKSGTTYKFKIRPYIKNSLTGKTIWGDYSEAFTVCTRPAKPTIKTLTATGNKATLTWNNVSGETGYQVYYSTSKNGTYKKLKSLSADNVKYSKSKLTSGKTYYFKVRAYKKLDGKTVFSDFSAVKSLKIK